ncbi:MAG: hypothetical protein ACLR3R_19585 [Clostridium paraputrificum]
MNIFWLDYDPKKSVVYYCDKHVVKMITEYAQLLSSCCRLTGVECGYKVSHRNHPCAIWLRESLTNWYYLRYLSFLLQDEYFYRYGKIHSAYRVISLLDPPNVKDNGLTLPPQCMPNVYKCDDLVKAYRNYYIGEKSSFATWKNREVPYWFNYNGVLIPNDK